MTPVPGLSYRAENAMTVGNDWSYPILMPNIDQLYLFNYLQPGFEAYLRWGTGIEDNYGDPIRVIAGANSWTDYGRYGFNAFQIKAIVPGSNPIIDFELQGL